MFEFDFSRTLSKKLHKLNKKNPVLANLFREKLLEIIHHDSYTIKTYKKAPLNHLKRVHLSHQFVLLFEVTQNKILFVDIFHRDVSYRKHS